MRVRARKCEGIHPPSDELPRGRFRYVFDVYLCDGCYDLWRQGGRPQDDVDAALLHEEHNRDIDIRLIPPQKPEPDDGW